MGIMDMFSQAFNSQQAPAAPAQGNTAPPNTPGSIPEGTPNTGAAGPGTAPNGTVPAVGTDNKETTPFDQFSDLWKNDAPSDATKPTGVFGNVDPKKFMEAAGKVDFSKAVTPEQIQAIQGGGEGAVQAFAQAMNKIAQNVYAQSAFATTKIVDQAVSRAKDSFIAEIPQHVKRHNVSETLRAENPVFSNPAVQPVISALEAQLSVKYPQASSGELTQMAKDYVEAMAISFAKKPAEPTGGNKGKEETDWSTFLA